MKVCQQCGFKNNDDTKFCVNCGNNIENAVSNESKICPQCGFHNNVDTKFCVNCGNELSDATPKEPEPEKQEEIQENAGEQSDDITEAQEEVEEPEVADEEEPVNEEAAEDTQESEKKTCPSCGHENIAETAFCVNCGTKMDDQPQEEQTDVEEEDDETNAQESEMITCASCGHENSAQTAFCVNCGNNLDANEPKSETQTVQTPVQPEVFDGPNTKFLKKEKKVINKISKQFCPIEDVFEASRCEEEYRKTAMYFDQWVSQYVMEGVPKMMYFGLYDHWRQFQSNCYWGLISFMVIGDYEGCLRNCDRLLQLEHIVYKKGIGSHTGSGLVAGIKTFAAMTGKTGTEEQQNLYKRIKLIKAACAYEVGNLQESYDLLIQLPPNGALKFKDRDNYFNQNFKYKDNLYVAIIKKRIEESR